MEILLSSLEILNFTEDIVISKIFNLFFSKQ